MEIQAERRARGFRPLPGEWLRRFEGWGMLDTAMGYVYRAGSSRDVTAAIKLAADSGRPLIARGSGYSYGDTALNAENIVLDMSGMNRILSWAPETGVVRAEPGVTIGDLWRRILRDGYWPSVVPGTMRPTLGGCLAVNAHGKNNWRAGTILDAIVAADIVLPDGTEKQLDRDRDAELVEAMAGTLGLLGVVISITLRVERVSSGLLEVEQHVAGALSDMFELLDAHRDAAYAVGWVDGFATGAAHGRGLVQVARHARSGAAQALDPAGQDLPPRLFGAVPRSELWRGMKLTVNDPGMRALNAIRFAMGARNQGSRSLVPLARFHFFHDYVPNWKWSFRPGGILQYQVFAPAATARALFADLLQHSRQSGFVPYLIVMKAHRDDSRTLLPYNQDGYSLSLDFHATPSNLGRLRTELGRWTDELVLPSGGRFYLAKDSVLTGQQATKMLGRERIERFLEWKERLDPNGLLQSNLYRRLFC